MIKVNKKMLYIALYIFFTIFLFSCTHEKESEIIEIEETEETVIIPEMDISDIKSDAERNLLLRIDNLNHTLGKDILITKEDYYNFRDTKVTLIGDSIADGALGTITKYFRNIFIDAVPGREIKEVYNVYNALYNRGKLGDIIIISLGTNASAGIELDLLEKVYQKIDGKPLFLLSIVIPYKGQMRNRNRDIKKFVETHDNCYLIDYNKMMNGRFEYFHEDHIHPTGAGSEVYTQLLFKAVSDYQKSIK